MYVLMRNCLISVCFFLIFFICVWKFAGISIAGVGEHYREAAEAAEHRTENLDFRRTVRRRPRLPPVSIFLQVSLFRSNQRWNAVIIFFSIVFNR